MNKYTIRERERERERERKRERDGNKINLQSLSFLENIYCT